MLMLTGSISVRRSPSPRASDCIHDQLRGDSGRQKGCVSVKQVFFFWEIHSFAFLRQMVMELADIQKRKKKKEEEKFNCVSKLYLV